MLSGCTTASDHHYSFTDQISNAVDIQVEAARKMGARVVLTRGSMFTKCCIYIHVEGNDRIDEVKSLSHCLLDRCPQQLSKLSLNLH